MPAAPSPRSAAGNTGWSVADSKIRTGLRMGAVQIVISARNGSATVDTTRSPRSDTPDYMLYIASPYTRPCGQGAGSLRFDTHLKEEYQCTPKAFWEVCKKQAPTTAV